MGNVEESAEEEAKKKGLSGEEKKRYVGGAFHRAKLRLGSRKYPAEKQETKKAEPAPQREATRHQIEDVGVEESQFGNARPPAPEPDYSAEPWKNPKLSFKERGKLWDIHYKRSLREEEERRKAERERAYQERLRQKRGGA